MEKDNAFGHMAIMIAAHLAPLLLFLILPKFGLSNKLTFVFAIISMAGMHIFMMKKHPQNHSSHSMKK